MPKRFHLEFASARRSGALRALLLRCAKSGRISLHDRLGVGFTAPGIVPLLSGMKHSGRFASAFPCANALKWTDIRSRHVRNILT